MILGGSISSTSRMYPTRGRGEEAKKSGGARGIL